MSADTRSAVEVLLSIENRLEKLEAEVSFIRSVDSTTKNILNRLNVLQKSKNVSQQQVQFKEAKAQAPPSVTPVDGVTNLLSTIEQRLLYASDQQPIILADIKIYEISTNSMVYKTTTAMSGKWHAALKAGKYRVQIKKGPVQDKGGVISSLDIEVFGDGKPMPLEKKLI